MIDEATYGELDRYYHAKMNTEEKSAFESRLASSEELRSELAWLNIMFSGMKEQGRLVMKQTISNALADVPKEVIARYKPSLNRKSFLKKWWWLIIGLVATTAIGIALYKYVNSHIDPLHHEEGGYRNVIDTSDCHPTDSSNIQTAVTNTDSSVVPKEKIAEEAQIAYGLKRMDSIKKMAPKPKNADTGFRLVFSVDKSENDFKDVFEPQYRTRLENMRTFINKRSQPPYTYTLEENLTLNANYPSTAGFRFEGVGDTIYMTDNAGLKFRLIHTSTEQPLLPIGPTK